MRKPTTIDGWLSIIRKLDEIPVSYLKGFDKLTKQQQQAISEISGTISNLMADIQN